MLDIRHTDEADFDAVNEIARDLVRAADTYAFAPDISDDELLAYWAPNRPGKGFVACFDDRVAGIFVIRPNQPGPGSHVANASFAVHHEHRGCGLGRAMGEASLVIARKQGFRAMQFNIVISTNVAAIRLWESLGFEIVGTIPGGFCLPDGTLVAHYIMHRTLD